MFLLTLLCPFSVVAWSIVENKNRSSPIPGVLLPRFLVQLNDSESLSDVDRTLAFLEWSKRSIDTAVSEERGSAGETQKDSICYPGPKTVNSRHIFYCDQLSRANETVSEAQDFFIQLANSTQSLAIASVPIASQFNWHLKEVESLREKVSTAGGQLGTSLEHTYNLATDILSNLTTLEIAALNTKIAESRPSHDPPMGIFNGTRSSKWPSPPNNFTKLPPIPSRPPPIFNGTGDRPRPRRPCRFNSSKVDRLLNGTDVRDDMAVQLLITTNTTDEDEDLCDDMPNMKHDRRFQVCNRSFWQQDFTKNQLFKKVQSLLGNQVSIIEKFVHFAKNSSTTDANFTMECEKFLNSTNLRQLMGIFTTGNHSMSSIVSSLTGSGLLSNSSSISSLLSEFQQSGNNGSQLSGILNGLSTTNITTLLSANNGSVSSSLSNIVSQLPSKIDSLKTAFLNNFGPNIPSIGQFLKGIVV